MDTIFLARKSRAIAGTTNRDFLLLEEESISSLELVWEVANKFFKVFFLVTIEDIVDEISNGFDDFFRKGVVCNLNLFNWQAFGNEVDVIVNACPENMYRFPSA